MNETPLVTVVVPEPGDDPSACDQLIQVVENISDPRALLQGEGVPVVVNLGHGRTVVFRAGGEENARAEKALNGLSGDFDLHMRLTGAVAFTGLIPAEMFNLLHAVLA